MLPDFDDNDSYSDCSDEYDCDCSECGDCDTCSTSSIIETIEFRMDPEFISLLEVYGDPKLLQQEFDEEDEASLDDDFVFRKVIRRKYNGKYDFMDEVALQMEEEALEAETMEMKEMNEMTYEGRTVAELVADPEIRRSLKNQIVLVLHAHRCMQKTEEELLDPRSPKPEGDEVCTFENCGTMQGVLSHMYECTVRKYCPFKYCSSSRLLIEHWTNCSKKGCSICAPLKALRSLPVPDIPQLSEPPSPQDKTGAKEKSDDKEAEPERPPKKRDLYLIPNGQPRFCPVPEGKTRLTELSPADLPMPQRLDNEDDWQFDLTEEIRNSYSLNIVRLFLPAEDDDTIDLEKRGLLTVARSVELISYGESEDLDEYYHLMGKFTIDNILRLEVKRGRAQPEHLEYSELVLAMYIALIIGENDLRPEEDEEEEGEQNEDDE